MKDFLTELVSWVIPAIIGVLILIGAAVLAGIIK